VRANWWMIGAMALVAAVCLGSLGYTRHTRAEPQRTIDVYFAGVVAGDSGKAESALTGSALTAFRRGAAVKPQVKAELTGTQTRWVLVTGTMAVADVTVQVKQSDSVDIQTARLSLVQQAQGWRIFNVEAAPLAYDRWPSHSTSAAVQVVNEYLRLSLAGDYDGALHFLAGQARSEAEATLSIVKQAKLAVHAENVKVSVADTFGSTVWITATYKAAVGGAEARPVRLLLEVRPVGGTLAIVKSDTL